jgi:hypothetical protein
MFDDKLQDIIESRMTYENRKEDVYPELTDTEISELCILYAYENKGEERFSNGLTIDNCGNINDLVRSIATLCRDLAYDDLIDAIDSIKDIASKSFVKAHGYEVIKIYENKLFWRLQDLSSSREEWDNDREDDCLFEVLEEAV